jgi:hypothetical protein
MKIYAVDSKKVINNYFDMSELADAPSGTSFLYTTSRYQYFVAQLVAVSDITEEVDVITSPLVGEGQELPKAVMCLNTAGISHTGLFFYRKLKLFAGKMQPLYIGFDLSEAKLGTFATTVTIGTVKVKLTLNLNDELVFNEGADDIYSGGRLKWLNSTLGVKDSPVKGYNILAIEENKLLFTGKEAIIANDGLISDVISFFTPSNYIAAQPQNNLFYNPMEFVVEGQRYRYSKQRVSGKGGTVTFSAEGRSEATRTEISGTAKYEGYIDYRIKLFAEKDIIINNIALNFYFAACTFNAGLGKRGGYFAPIEYVWDNAKQHDSVFVGDINCGARVRFKDKQDMLPFEGELYKYKPFKLPVFSWDNRGAGGITLAKTDKGAALTAYTGKVVLPAGKSMEFNFELHFTPFRQPDLAAQFGIKMANIGDEGPFVKRVERASWYKNNAVELTWGKPPYNDINYPFTDFCDIKNAILVARSKGFKVSLDYSLWHTSENNPELNCFKAFGSEFIHRAQEGDRELSNKFGAGTVAAVRQSSGKGGGQASVLLETDSRMDNYFAEAVGYIYENLRADGIGIEGAHVCRDVAERIRRISDGCAAALGITLKESNNFTEERALANSLNIHTHILPFVDRISADASFDGCRDEDYILTEVSGALYGVPAEYASPSFNAIEALLYGMRIRCGEGGEKNEAFLESLYGVLERFGIGGARMYGFWDKTNPASTDKQDVKLTSYINGGKLLAVVFNKSKKPVEFDIGINPKLGYTSAGKTITTPLVIGLQNEKAINFNKSFRLKGNSGMLLLVE